MSKIIITDRFESLKVGDVITAVNAVGVEVERKVPEPTYRLVEVFKAGATVSPGGGSGFAAENGMGYWHMNTIASSNTNAGATWDELVDEHKITAYIEYAPRRNGEYV